MILAICSDRNSWINKHISDVILLWLAQGNTCQVCHDAKTLTGGDICFYLSYGEIVGKKILERYRNNLVVHASDLPKGRGWSPASWTIIDGKNEIPVTLLEAAEQVDSGAIYNQTWIALDNNDLVDDWRSRLAAATKNLVVTFVKNYPNSIESSRKQIGEPSFYPKRNVRDSQLDPDRTIAEQFNLLRIVDNKCFPAFFMMHGEEFILEIRKRNSINS
jgi:methionyl-tRNA formyltransferase